MTESKDVKNLGVASQLSVRKRYKERVAMYTNGFEYIDLAKRI